MSARNPYRKYLCECGEVLYGRMIQPDPYTAPEWDGYDECPECGAGIDEASPIIEKLVTLPVPVNADGFEIVPAVVADDEDIPF